METEDQSKERQLAITIVQSASPSDQILLQQWITQLLVLKDAPIGKLEKPRKPSLLQLRARQPLQLPRS
jgi:hypothetical protein